MCNSPRFKAFSAACAAAANRCELPRYGRDEIASSRHDVLIVENKVYDAERFRWEHPGGALFISLFGGRDATLAFQSYHMRPFPHDAMKEYLVGELDGEVVSPDPELYQLAKLVKPKVSHRGFAPPPQLFKAALLFIAAVILELACLIDRTWGRSFALGLLFALIGLNIQHDANHGAMFGSSKWKNVVCGLAQGWIGGSQLMWLQEHVVLHHLHTCDVKMDPDAQMAPALRAHAQGPWYPWMLFQKCYLLLLELGYGTIPIFVALVELLCWRHKLDSNYELSRLAMPWAAQSIALHLLFYVRLLVVPYYQGEIRKVIATFGAGGFYLAFFFFLSHNFEGVSFVEGGRPDGSSKYSNGIGFLRQQVASSSNVGGSWLCFLNGGLNYQIEHHLFPRLAHSHYPKIAPVVKRFMLDKAPYVHFDTVQDNLRSVFQHLDRFGRRPVHNSLKVD